MKVGDLVKPVNGTGLPSDHWRSNETIGIVTEVHAARLVGGIHQIWVKWSNHSDFSFEYSDGVEIISEAK